MVAQPQVQLEWDYVTSDSLEDLADRIRQMLAARWMLNGGPVYGPVEAGSDRSLWVQTFARIKQVIPPNGTTTLTEGEVVS